MKNKYTRKNQFQLKNKTKKRANKSKINKNLDIKYPFYNSSIKIDLNKIRKLVASKKKELTIYDNKPTEKYTKYNKDFIPFNNTNKYYFIESKWNDNLELNRLTDYFSAKCRMNCKFYDNKSVIEYWNENKYNIISVLKKKGQEINYINVNEEIYSRNKRLFCNNFRISVCLEILSIFKPKKWLDISAGWGDRLISALLHDTVEEYCGVDPNPCVQNAYKDILKVLNTKQKRCTLIKDGFETAKLPNTKYDIVFSSPPFFTLEIYSSNTENSVMRYGTVDRWFNGFLMPSIKKGLEHLQVGGHLVLYMGEAGTEEKYIPRMISETDKMAKNIGIIYYSDAGNVRTFYCWEKK